MPQTIWFPIRILLKSFVFDFLFYRVSFPGQVFPMAKSPFVLFVFAV